MANQKDRYGEPRKHWKCGCGSHSVHAGNKRNRHRALALRDIGYFWAPPIVEKRRNGKVIGWRQINILTEPCPPDENLKRYGEIEHSMRRRENVRQERFVVQLEQQQTAEEWLGVVA